MIKSLVKYARPPFRLCTKNRLEHVMTNLSPLRNRFVPCALGVALSLCAMSAVAFADGKREFPQDCYLFLPDDPMLKALDPLVGKPMPPLQLAHWINGAVTPADMKGKVVVIDIFATWCSPCIAAIPHNNQLYEAHKADGLLIVGVCTSDDGQDKLPDLAKEKKIAYPVAQDPDSKTADAYHVQGMPTVVVVDRKGIVRAAGLSPQGMETVVDKLLAEK